MTELEITLLDAMKKFCHRVEIGEIRSKNTYAEFIDLINKAKVIENKKNKYFLDNDEIVYISDADDQTFGMKIPVAFVEYIVDEETIADVKEHFGRK